MSADLAVSNSKSREKANDKTKKKKENWRDIARSVETLGNCTRQRIINTRWVSQFHVQFFRVINASRSLNLLPLVGPDKIRPRLSTPLYPFRSFLFSHLSLSLSLSLFSAPVPPPLFPFLSAAGQKSVVSASRYLSRAD